MEYCIFPMRIINITQRALDSFSHKNLEAWDIAGKDTGIESAYAPCTCKVLSILSYSKTGFSNTVFFGSCDANGNPAKVLTNNGTARILTFALSHDNDISDISVGQIYKSGEKIYDEGTCGPATGNHIHLEVGEGWQYKKVKRADGVYSIPNIVHIEDVFFMLKGWNEIKRANGYTFKEVESRVIFETFSVYYENNANNITNLPQNQTKRTGQTIYISTQIPIRPGYKFKHWTVFADGTGTIYNPGDAYTGDWSSSLYAVWEPTEYVLNYNGNTEDTVTNVPSFQIRGHDTAPIVISSKIPNRIGYKFLHWNSQPDDSGYVYKPGDMFDHNWYTCLWAQWIKLDNDCIKYTLSDAMKAFKYISGKRQLTEEEKILYDINKDGKITLSDVMSIFKKVAGK